MSERIQISTPIIYEKFVLPPPRKLWVADSPTEQLYLNRWKKYRNTNVDDNKKSWGNIDAPNFVDFEDISDNHDTDFDNANDKNFITPHKFTAHQWPEGFDEDNNNLLEELKKCTLSTIKKSNRGRRDEAADLSDFIEQVDPISIIFVSLEKSNLTTEKSDENGKNKAIDTNPSIFGSLEKSNLTTTEKSDENVKNKATIFGSIGKSIVTNTEKIEPSQQSVLKSEVEKPNAVKSKIDKKICTTVEPFSFEMREKCMDEHKKARRERDSIDKETWKGFRANPLPNFLKTRAKIASTAKTQPESKEPTNIINKCQIRNVGEIWKKKPFQPVYPKRVPIVPKAPELSTAARAKNRQRFEEYIKEKERQRLALQKMEEAERKKREEEEIAKLRRELVHKAQPIRKYKMIVPKVEKRPLTEPTTPIMCKRRRKN